MGPCCNCIISPLSNRLQLHPTKKINNPAPLSHCVYLLRKSESKSHPWRIWGRSTDGDAVQGWVRCWVEDYFADVDRISRISVYVNVIDMFNGDWGCFYFECVLLGSWSACTSEEIYVGVVLQYQKDRKIEKKRTVILFFSCICNVHFRQIQNKNFQFFLCLSFQFEFFSCNWDLIEWKGWFAFRFHWICIKAL